MGRPRQHATPAARQAACRQRQRETTVVVDRQMLEQVETGWQQFQAAVAPLARSGDLLASQLYRTNLVTGLEMLTGWFRQRAAKSGYL